jgi:hypothetical protein
MRRRYAMMLALLSGALIVVVSAVFALVPTKGGLRAFLM